MKTIKHWWMKFKSLTNRSRVHELVDLISLKCPYYSKQSRVNVIITEMVLFYKKKIGGGKPEIHIEPQRTLNVQNKLEKEQSSRHVTFWPHDIVKLQYQNSMIKIRSIHPWNRIQSPGIDPHMCSISICRRMARAQNNGEKLVSSKNDVQKTGYPHAREWNRILTLHHIQKLN